MRYDELKVDLTLCTGTRKGSGDACRGTLFKCGHCGSIGCRQTRPDLCSNQGFSVLGHCEKCHAVGSMETIEPGDYTPQQSWLSGSGSAAD
jgi:hypothetical protein